jgi:hypothetical protein
MSLFADNEEQLNLLTTDEVPADKPWAGAVESLHGVRTRCAMQRTTTETGFRVDMDIDSGIAEQHDQAITALRPFQIPNPNGLSVNHFGVVTCERERPCGIAQLPS